MVPGAARPRALGAPRRAARPEACLPADGRLLKGELLGQLGAALEDDPTHELLAFGPLLVTGPATAVEPHLVTAPLPAPHGLHVGDHPGAEAEALKEATIYLVALLAALLAALRAIPCDTCPSGPPCPPGASARVPPLPTIGAAFHRAAARVGGALAHARWALG